MLTRLAWLTVRRRRLVLALSALFVFAAAALGSGAFGVLEDGGFEDPNAESTRAEDVMDESFADGGADVVLLATVANGSVDDPDVVADGEALTGELADWPGLADVTSYWSEGRAPPLRSGDGDEALILASIADEDEDVVVDDLKDWADEQGGTLDVAVGGPEGFGTEVGTAVESSLGRAELIAVPLTLLLLLFVFRGWVAASLPLLIGGMAIMGTFLVLFALGSITDVSIYSVNLTTALGLGLAIDYSLFVVSRYREELRGGLSVEDAVVRSIETAGRTVTISALIVAVSLSALLIFPMYFLRSFAYAGIAVVLLAMAGAVVTLPALLAAIGPRIDSRRARRRAAAAAAAGEVEVAPETHGFWHRVASAVMRRPLPVALGVTALLLLLGSPFLRLSTGLPDERVLPPSSEARQVSERIQADFEGDSSESFPVVMEPAPSETALDDYARRVSQVDGVARVDGPGGIYQGGEVVAEGGGSGAGDPARYVGDDAAWLEVVPAVTLQSAEGEHLVEDIRALGVGDAADAGSGSGTEALVGGSAAQLVDTKDSLTRLLPWGLVIVAITTIVLLFAMTGSVLIPLKAVVLNLLSLTATFGAMVWVFQDGHLSGVLDFSATGRLDASTPILMFCIAFGLSMDYEVFLLSRIKEEHDRTGDNTAAVALGVERTGRIVSAAASLLAITFLAFGTADVSFLKLFGVGLALAVVMDATVIRGLLVPAFMRLAGNANWWAPRPLRAIHRRIALSEAS
jgi:putative drug exporter of the RND superfamily